jgi:RNA polymerase sigma-70 factor (ECF subfamily)
MNNGVSDEELVLRALTGSPEERQRAFDMLIERHYETASSAAYTVLNDTDAAKDCAQEAFKDVVRTLGDLRDKSKFGQWIYMIARQQAILVLRQKKRHREALQTKGDESRHMLPAGSPSEQMARSEKLESIRKALSQLPEIYREVLVLKCIDGRSHEDIAKILNLSMAAVDKRLMRGKEMLRASLQRWRIDE